MLRDTSYGLTVAVEPTEEPVYLEGDDGAKAHLKVDGSAEDGTISALITAARSFCEGYQRRAYVTQTLELTLDRWPTGDRIELPMPPLQSVISVTYLDKDGNQHTFDSANYFAATKKEPGRLVLADGKSWPSVSLRPAEAITIRYVAGYGGPESVPEKIKQAIKLLIGHWYLNREAVQSAMARGESPPIPLGVDALLWQDIVR